MTRIASALCLLALLMPLIARAGVRVEIEGLGSDEKGNVEARLGILQQANDKNLSQELVERLNEQAPADIRSALQPFGWYQPTIKAKLSGSKPDWVARYHVDAGPRTNITKVDVQLLGEGAEHEAFKKALKRANRRLVVGDRLKHADYEDVKKLITDAAYAGGFLDAYWAVSELRVNPAAQQAEIYLHLQTGPRYFFGHVTFEQQGDQGLNPKFINRYIALKEGNPFDPQKVLDQQLALSDLGYFESVEITPQRSEADEQHRVPLTIHTTPRKRHRYTAGVGYGTDTGARVSLGTEWRQINQYGHNLDADARISQIKNTGEANYRIPLGAKPGENLTFSAIQELDNLAVYNTSKQTLGVSINRHPGVWQKRLYLDFSHEDSTLGDQNPHATLLTPGVSFTRTDSDDPIFAHRGWYLFTDVHGAAKDVASTTSFLRVYALTRGVYSLDRKTRLLGRMELGANFHDSFADLPATQRFFAGGDESVRGYSYQSLGSHDSEGNIVGGQYLATFSGELERSIVGPWGAAVFADSGGAGDRFLPRQYVGVGAGLRYRAPVGVFQVDLAHPLTGDHQGQFAGLRLHVGIRIGL